MKKRRLPVLFILIGFASALALTLLYYWILRLDSNLVSLITNTKKDPLYLWLYFSLTAAAVIIFGANTAGFFYLAKKFRHFDSGKQAGNLLGAAAGIFASACPVCGSLLLSAIGLTAGLAAFPLKGLEIKAVSLALIGASTLITARNLKHKKCQAACRPRRRMTFSKNDQKLLATTLLLIIFLSASFWNIFKYEPFVPSIALEFSFWPPKIAFARTQNSQLFETTLSKVIPQEGYQSKISLGDSVVKMAAFGVIDPAKMRSYFAMSDPMSAQLDSLLVENAKENIKITLQNSELYLDLLWPLGIANAASVNRVSPVNSPSLFNFASTGGWFLGISENGGTYFNRYAIVSLTQEQEQRLLKIAENIYRPCCNNSTFFQDCNHGSALYGLLQLGISQGLTDEELYREALAFNSYFFPQNYVKTAIYFKLFKNKDWDDVDPGLILSKEYSSSRGFMKNIAEPLSKVPGLFPAKTSPGTGC